MGHLFWRLFQLIQYLIMGFFMDHYLSQKFIKLINKGRQFILIYLEMHRELLENIINYHIFNH